MVKMKLNKEQKGFRKENRTWLFKKGGFFIYCGTDTFLFLPQFPGSTTFSMCTALCHPNDEYNRKYGEWQALEMWITGISVLVSREFATEMCYMSD